MGSDGDASPHAGGDGEQVVQMQRARILEAMVDVIAERGYGGATVGLVCIRAKVSRRTFYECFESFEECFLAILDGGMEVMGAVMSHAFQGNEDWLDGLLAAEAAVLSFLDSQPQAARVLLVETLAAGSWALERRERNVAALRELIVERFKDSPIGGDFPPLASTGVMASLLGIMQDHLLRGEPAPLISLLGPLMGVITSPYLPPEDVAREIHRGEELACRIQAEQDLQLSISRQDRDGAAGGHRVEFGVVEIPAILRNSRAVRARKCVLYLAEQGRLGSSPSNREIAAGIGIATEGQASKLLARLERAGILSKFSYGPGKPNACRLTPYGQEIASYFELHENG